MHVYHSNDPQQPYYPPQPPQRTYAKGCRNVAIYLILGIVGILALIGINATDNDYYERDQLPLADAFSSEPAVPKQTYRPTEDVPASEPEVEEIEEPKLPGIGDTVRDGEFAFKVTKVEKRSTMGEGLLAEEAQGQFVVFHVTIKNVGDETETWSAGYQKLYDRKGREFEADTALYEKDANAFLEKINPGNTLKSKLFFDVPKGSKLATLELHDSLFSGGVQVDLQSK